MLIAEIGRSPFSGHWWAAELSRVESDLLVMIENAETQKRRDRSQRDGG